jgi:hypothetical protein
MHYHYSKFLPTSVVFAACLDVSNQSSLFTLQFGLVLYSRATIIMNSINIPAKSESALRLIPPEYGVRLVRLRLLMA